MAQRDLKDIKMDENWITPTGLAAMLDIPQSTVSSWIRRDQIDYILLPGALKRQYLVDRRTAPEKKPSGWPAKKSK